MPELTKWWWAHLPVHICPLTSLLFNPYGQDTALPKCALVHLLGACLQLPESTGYTQEAYICYPGWPLVFTSVSNGTEYWTLKAHNMHSMTPR